MTKSPSNRRASVRAPAGAPKRAPRSVRPSGVPTEDPPAPKPKQRAKPDAAEAAEIAPTTGSASDEDPASADDEIAEVGDVLAGGDVAALVDEPLEDEDSKPWSSEGERTKALVAVEPGHTALSRRDPFQAYLHEVQRYPLLTPERETELTRRYHETGDVNVAAQLVTANLRLVIKIAYEYRRAYRNIMDLIQEGNIGLMQAVKRYDPFRGVKLSSYAAWWIRAYMLRFILNNWRLVKVGTTQAQRKLFFNLNKQKAKLSAMGVEPSAKEIAERLGVHEKEVVEMDRRMSSAETSLDAPLGDAEGRTVSRSDMLPSSSIAADDSVADQEISELLAKHLKSFRETLSGKDVTIFDRRMVADEPITLQKLGDEFGVSRERVRQLEARLAGRLREYLKEHLGDAADLGLP